MVPHPGCRKFLDLIGPGGLHAVRQSEAESEACRLQEDTPPLSVIGVPASKTSLICEKQWRFCDAIQLSNS
jgi:hypothetical protein